MLAGNADGLFWQTILVDYWVGLAMLVLRGWGLGRRVRPSLYRAKEWRDRPNLPLGNQGRGSSRDIELKGACLH